MEDDYRRQQLGTAAGAADITNESWEAIQDAVSELGRVGFLTGYYDETLTIAQVSQFTLETLGYTFEEFMWATKGSLYNFFYGENRTFLKENRFKRLFGIGEGQVLTKDGAPFYVRMCKRDSVDAQGRPIWVVALQLDWMQQNLKLINNVYRSGMWYFDCDRSNNITGVFWSHEFRLLLGYHDVIDFPNEISSWVNLIHPDDRERVFVCLQETLADQTDQTKFDVEYRMQLRDQTYQWFRVSAETTRRLDGSVRRIAGTFVNIDERKRVEMHAKRNEAFHRAYTKGNICEYFLNLEANSFDSLKVEDSLLGIFEKSTTWDELIIAYLDYYVFEEDRESVARFYDRRYIAEQFAQGVQDLQLECRIMLRGEEHCVSNVVMNGEAEGTRYAMIFVRDITQQRQQELKSRRELEAAYDAANRANEAKTEFLSNMSHDIRTPMNAIVGMTAIAAANIDNQDRVADCLGKITQASRHLLGLINEVLDMSKIESGRVELAEEDFKLTDLVDNMVAMTRGMIVEHQHQLKLKIGAIDHEYVRGDSLRIQQVITNILGNAIKYTPDGGMITFSLRELPNKSVDVGCYEFVIADNGVGMSEEFQKVLFEPFTREDDKRIGNVQGSGLGMAIARNIVGMMNGQIQVNSAPGAGSTFTVRIYLQLQPPASLKNLLEHSRTSDVRSCLDGIAGCDYSDRRILLVEDNELNREVASEIIGMSGAMIETAANGKEAVDRIAAAKDGYYQLVFMDIQMPVMNGYEAAAAIRALPEQKGASIAIVAMTANAFAEDVQLAKQAGMNDHITKPLDIETLEDVLKTWLK